MRWQLLYLIIPDGSECAQLLSSTLNFGYSQMNFCLSDQLRGAGPAVLLLPDDAGTPVLLEASERKSVGLGVATPQNGPGTLGGGVVVSSVSQSNQGGYFDSRENWPRSLLRWRELPRHLRDGIFS